MSDLFVKAVGTQIVPQKIQNKVAYVTMPALLAGFGIKLKPQPTQDTFEISNPQKINRSSFINEFINNKDVEDTIKTHDFAKYGKKGVTLQYSREDFAKDVNNIIKKLPNEKQISVLSKYNLRKGEDIDGIANITDKTPETEEESKLQGYITKFYNNKVNTKDEKFNDAMNKLINGMPEFTMTMGKVQHGTHIYSVDIHTLIVLQKCLNNHNYDNLSEDDKEVLKLSVLMHDFGKNGRVVTKGHAAQSKIDAEMILQNYDIKSKIKERVLKQVENHHWFENYNMGVTNANDVKEIFKTPEDLAIAKIMAKSDLEGISPTFHRQILNYGKFLTQEEFDTEFAKKVDKIQI